MVFNTRLPEFLSTAMISELKANRRLILLKLAGTDFNVKVVSFVGDLKDLGPSESIDA